ncbi:MAG: hypothetical protein JWQ72_3644 [Polaromonas sp.]|nr:hypothetical protein [Polaromonas sp.]
MNVLNASLTLCDPRLHSCDFVVKDVKLSGDSLLRLVRVNLHKPTHPLRNVPNTMVGSCSRILCRGYAGALTRWFKIGYVKVSQRFQHIVEGLLSRAGHLCITQRVAERNKKFLGDFRAKLHNMPYSAYVRLSTLEACEFSGKRMLPTNNSGAGKDGYNGKDSLGPARPFGLLHACRPPNHPQKAIFRWCHFSNAQWLTAGLNRIFATVEPGFKSFRHARCVSRRRAIGKTALRLAGGLNVDMERPNVVTNRVASDNANYAPLPSALLNKPGTTFRLHEVLNSFWHVDPEELKAQV